MESTKSPSHESTGSAGHSTSSSTNPTASAPSRAKQTQDIKDRANEVFDQTKNAVSNAYEQTTQTLGNTYDQAITYGRDNPGTAMLIAFGAGVVIGVLLASSMSGRGRMSRIGEPIVTALSQVALEFLR